MVTAQNGIIWRVGSQCSFKGKKCVCASPMNKKEQVKEIIKALLDNCNHLGYYRKAEIEKAIMLCRGSDNRTIRNWFKFLWRLEYFIQPHPHVYQLNMERIVDLEISIPIQIDPKQRRLEDVYNIKR